MKKERRSSAVLIFIGLLLTAVFVVGRIASRNPGAFQQKYYVDTTLELFVGFCREWWIPAGVIGIPLFLISMGISLWREHRENQKNRP